MVTKTTACKIEPDNKSESGSCGGLALGQVPKLLSACGTVAVAADKEKSRRKLKLMLNIAERVVPDTEPRKWLSKVWQGYKTLLEKKVEQETARVKLWRLGLESGTRKMQERKVPQGHNLNYDTFSLMKECDEFLKSYAEMQASMEDLAKEDLKELEEKYQSAREAQRVVCESGRPVGRYCCEATHPSPNESQEVGVTVLARHRPADLLGGRGSPQEPREALRRWGAACEPEDADGVP